MIVLHYNEVDHRLEIDRWCRGWKMRPFPYGWLPHTGFIIEGVAAMWVYLTDSLIAVIENVISNPESSKDDRDIGLVSLEGRCAAFARTSGYKYLMGASRNQRLLDKCAKLGYTISAPLNQILKEI